MKTLQNIKNASCNEYSPQAKTSINWLPFTHNMGLFAGIFYPILVGKPCYLATAQQFLKNPLGWLQCISTLPDVVSGGPQFAYHLCIQHMLKHPLPTLNLSSWALAFTGADATHPDLFDKFFSIFEPYGFNRSHLSTGYGLTEATVLVSGDSLAKPPTIKSFCQQALSDRQVVPASSTNSSAVRLMSAGMVFENMDAIIVNPDTKIRCAENGIGEVWLRGPSISPGFFHQIESTEVTFDVYTKDELGPYCRTGDLGFLFEGELYITGRLKEALIIRGKNIPPQYIESTIIDTVPALAKAPVTVFSIPGDHEELLILAIETNEQMAPLVQSEMAAIRQTIIHHFGVKLSDVVLIKENNVPRNALGKIKRHALASAYLDKKLVLITPPKSK